MPYNYIHGQVPPPWNLPASALRNNQEALPPAHPISPPNNFKQPINIEAWHPDLNTYHHNIQRDKVNMPGIDHPGLENYRNKDSERKVILLSNDVEGGNSLGMEIHDKNSQPKILSAKIKQSFTDQSQVRMIRGHVINR